MTARESIMTAEQLIEANKPEMPKIVANPIQPKKTMSLNEHTGEPTF